MAKQRSTPKARARSVARAAKPARRATRPRLGRPPGDTSAQTRASILAAARECFARVGYERATNRDIAKEAGVTAGAIYQYYDSKTALYLAVVVETIDEIMPRLEACTRDKGSARAALSALVREQLGSSAKVSATHFLSSIPIEMQRHPELAAGMLAHPGKFFDLVLEIVKSAVRSQEVAPEKAERLLGVFMAALMGLSMHGAAVGGSHSEAATQGFIDLLEGTLFR